MSEANFDIQIKKYGKTVLNFDRHYKYNFYYKGTTYDGKDIVVSNYGGDSVYRADLTSEMSLSDLNIELELNYMTIGDEVYERYV